MYNSIPKEKTFNNHLPFFFNREKEQANEHSFIWSEMIRYAIKLLSSIIYELAILASNGLSDTGLSFTA